MTYTKDDFAREYGLPNDEVQSTLRACRLSTQKETYTEAERERFATARNLFNEGTATSYDDVEAYFQDEDTLPLEDESESLENESEPLENVNPRVVSAVEALRQEAIAQGFSIGMLNAETIAQVIPQATMLRLLQLIESGELRQEFERYWTQAFPVSELGKKSVAPEEIANYWTQLQISASATVASLPSSSTESSDNE